MYFQEFFILFFTLLLWICLSCSCGESDFVGSWYKFTEIDDSKLVLTNDNSFCEEHKGIDDVMIEKEIVCYCKKHLPNFDARLW